MATAYYSSRGSAGQSAKANTGVVVDYAEFTVPAAGFALNDTVTLFNLPKNARVLGFVISFPILDSNGAPTCTVDVGDTQTGATAYVNAANLGTHFSAAVDMVFPGSGSGNVQGFVGTRYLANDALVMKIAAAPATAATTGTIRSSIVYEMDGGSQTGI